VVRERIGAIYGFEAALFHPPHSVDLAGRIEPIRGLEDFVGEGGHFLIVSRLLPYKNVDRAIEAFRGLGERLLVVGDGPLRSELQERRPANVRLAAGLGEAQMRWAYSTSKALLAPSYEDFGITPLEAGAWGKPTIALRAGGYLDTIVEGVTGSFIERPTAEAIRAAVLAFERGDWDPELIQARVADFSEERFQTWLRAEVAYLARTTR
jgi:glycosyltransferase involved in cell wall biosynthesis